MNRSCTVIPFTCPLEKAPTPFGDSELVTEMWIERCIAANSPLNAQDFVVCSPMPGPFPRSCNIRARFYLILDLRDLAISISGFSGPDLLHIERLIPLLGGDYYKSLTRKRSLLLIQDEASGHKIRKALQWRVPVVKVGWLWEVILQGDNIVDIGPWCKNPRGMQSWV